MSSRRKRPGRSDPLPVGPLDEEGNPIWAGPSRSQVRREASAASDLALRLVKLPRARLPALGLSDEVREAVELGARLTKGALARQLRLIAKLLRDLPAETLATLEEVTSPGYRPGPSAEQRQDERWRERLLGEGDAALGQFVEQFPGAEKQRLRQLIRQAKTELPTERSRRAARDLLRTIRAARCADAPPDDAPPDAPPDGSPDAPPTR